MTSERFQCARVGMVTRRDCSRCFGADPRRAADFMTRAICASAHGRWFDEATPSIPQLDALPRGAASRVA